MSTRTLESGLLPIIHCVHYALDYGGLIDGMVTYGFVGRSQGVHYSARVHYYALVCLTYYYSYYSGIENPTFLVCMIQGIDTSFNEQRHYLCAWGWFRGNVFVPLTFTHIAPGHV